MAQKTILSSTDPSNAEFALTNTVMAFKANTNGTLQMAVKVNDTDYVNFGDNFTADTAQRSDFATAVIRFTVTGDGELILYHEDFCC